MIFPKIQILMFSVIMQVERSSIIEKTIKKIPGASGTIPDFKNHLKYKHMQQMTACDKNRLGFGVLFRLLP